MAKLRSILLVDDSDRCIELMSLAFAAAGAQDVRSESDSHSALMRIKADPVDLVLLDIKMPGMSGIQVLDTLRGAGNATPVLICSGSVRQQDVDQAFKSGCNGYFGKPDSLEDYRSMARTILDYWSRGDVPNPPVTA